MWQQCEKLKLPPPPLPPKILEIKFSQTFKDIPKVLKNFKFLNLTVDEIVGGPVPTLFGIKCGLQTPWYKKGKDKRIYPGITVPDSNKLFHESLYIVGRKP